MGKRKKRRNPYVVFRDELVAELDMRFEAHIKHMGEVFRQQMESALEQHWQARLREAWQYSKKGRRK